MGLGDAMKDKKNFDNLPSEIKKAVYGFLKSNRDVRRLNQKIEKEKEIYKNKIAPYLKLLDKAIDDEKNNYDIIKNIPNNFYTLSGLYVDKQKDRRNYFLDIRWKASDIKRRKVAIGNSLSQIQSKLKLIDIETKLRFKNYKSVIPDKLKYVVNDFVLKNGVEKFNNDDLHIVWDEKGKFKYEKVKVGKGVNKNKKDRWNNTPKSTKSISKSNSKSLKSYW